MPTADIQFYDGFTFSPVLHLDEIGEDVFHIINQTFKVAVFASTRFHLSIDRLFGALVNTSGEYLDATDGDGWALHDVLALTVCPRYSLLRERGQREPEHFGSFVVLVRPDDPVSACYTIYSGNLSSEAEKEISRKSGNLIIGPIEPLKNLNDEVARMEEKQNLWLNSSERRGRAEDIPPNDLWRFREMERRESSEKDGSLPAINLNQKERK